MHPVRAHPEPASPPELTTNERRLLLDVALDSVVSGLDTGQPLRPDPTGLPPTLLRPGATFVTLRRDGALAGCIGTIEPVRSLVDDVAHNAWSAAFADPRLRPVTRADLPILEVSISVLGPPIELDVDSREQLIESVEPGLDGLLIRSPGGFGHAGHHATFLPSVWEQLPDPDDFLDHLWRKAGLRPRTWPDDLVVERYRTLEFDAA